MKYDGATKYDENVALKYEDDRRNEPHWQAEQAFMAGYVARERLGRILDLPVGTGRFFEYYGGADSVLGLDISRHMLEQARRKASSTKLPALDLMEADALALPCADSHFDHVVCFRLVHLLPPELVPKLFAELARATRGKLLMQIYAAPDGQVNGWIRGLRSRVGSLLPFLRRREETKPWSHIQSYPHTGAFLLDSAQRAGLKLVHRHVIASYLGSSVDVLELKK